MLSGWARSLLSEKKCSFPQFLRQGSLMGNPPLGHPSARWGFEWCLLLLCDVIVISASRHLSEQWWAAGAPCPAGRWVLHHELQRGDTGKAGVAKQPWVVAQSWGNSLTLLGGSFAAGLGESTVHFFLQLNCNGIFLSHWWVWTPFRPVWIGMLGMGEATEVWPTSASVFVGCFIVSPGSNLRKTERSPSHL